jgi:hypothetical protein
MARSVLYLLDIFKELIYNCKREKTSKDKTLCLKNIPINLRDISVVLKKEWSIVLAF